MTKLKLSNYSSLACSFKRDDHIIMGLLDEIIYIPIMAYAKYEVDFCSAWGVSKPPLSWDEFYELFEEDLTSSSISSLDLLTKN